MSSNVANVVDAYFYLKQLIYGCSFVKNQCQFNSKWLSKTWTATCIVLKEFDTVWRSAIILSSEIAPSDIVHGQILLHGIIVALFLYIIIKPMTLSPDLFWALLCRLLSQATSWWLWLTKTSIRSKFEFQSKLVQRLKLECTIS